MINLITGLPGHGKSLFTLWHVKNRIERENKELISAGKEARTVYYNGIPELTLDWVQFDTPEKWFELPPGSIIVIDEAQRTFRPRGNAASVPDHVRHLETHRHHGHDLYVITQHPLLLDGNLRRLVDRHYHVHRPFGWSKSTVLDFQGVKDQPMQKSNRADAQKSKFVFPKELYKCYKSAEVHTVKARLPGQFIFLALVPFLLIGMGWFAWTKLKHVSGAPETTASASLPAGYRSDQIGRSDKPKPMTREEYIDGWQPRIAGLQHTAPRYDDVTKPVRAPFPDACMATAKKCQCYSKQGTVLDVGDVMCRQIVERGFYRDFDDMEAKQNDTRVLPANQSLAAAPAPASTGPVFRQIGGDAPKSLDGRWADAKQPSETAARERDDEQAAARQSLSPALALANPAYR